MAVDKQPHRQGHSAPNKAEIAIVLPRLQEIAKDVAAAMEAGSAALRERSLERILSNLIKLQVQLPGLGLKTSEIKRWEPVIGRWQRIIELEKNQQLISEGELLNPFQYGNPLRANRSYLFKGRQVFADQIVRLVLDRNRPTLVLYGPRRCGKSSFLLNLPRLLPSDLLPVYLDLQRASMTDSDGDFCYGLVNAIHRDSRSQGLELPVPPARDHFHQSPYSTLDDWLEQVLPRLGERRLLLNLDEFEKIGSAIHEKRISLRLFDELRSLVQHTDQLGFLFSGVQTLDELGPNWSSFFISVIPIEILYLKPSEAEDLLRDPDPEFAFRYASGVVEEILRLTRCQPYLLQLLGSALVTQANLQEAKEITSEHLEAAIQDAFTLGEPYFINIWVEFTGTNLLEISAGQELLLSLSQNNLFISDPTNPSVQTALRRLQRYHVVEKVDGNYHIEIPLFKQWVQERAIRTYNQLS